MKKALSLTVVFLVMAAAIAAAQPPDRAQAVRDQYIVVFKDTVADVPGLAYELARVHGGRPLFVYEHAIKGFAVELPEQAVEGLSHNPHVAYIEPDMEVWATQITQSPATWGLDRIDQHLLPLDGSYTYNLIGAGVTAYIIDTGIRFSHNDFEGRAFSGFDAVDGGTADDCNGHGTHVAGTVGGATYGVAKSVHLVAVRVLACDGSGTTSGVIAGVDWVTANAIKPAVANMSLGGGASSTLDAAVKNSIASGVSYAVAAGNGNIFGIAQDACKSSPARVPEAMTIGATNSSDVKASWSNYGNCVDWFAPGVSITSAWYTSDTATNTIGGTSMATPHTTGVAALYLEANREASPEAVRTALYDATTKGIVASSRTANNHLLYSLFGGTVPPPPEPPASGEIILGATTSISRAVYYANLTWSGAASSLVDVHRDGVFLVTTANDGAYSDKLGKKVTGSYTYKVCEAGSTTACSNSVTITF